MSDTINNTNDTTSDVLLPGISAADLVPTGKAVAVDAPVRLRTVNRFQTELRPVAIDDLIGPDHFARVLWQLVERWDMSSFDKAINARQGICGRNATDPRVLLALWLYAAVKNMGSARELARLCEEHRAFMWIAGGISLNHHTLSDFRKDHEAALDSILSQMIATLSQGGAIQIKRIAQDGTRVRSCAGRRSFKMRTTLEEDMTKANAHIEKIKSQLHDTTISPRKKAAKQRAAEQRVQRIENALEQLKLIEEAKAQQKNKPSKKSPAKASITDPESRLMRMPNGGVSPGYNIQFATVVDDSVAGPDAAADTAEVVQPAAAATAAAGDTTASTPVPADSISSASEHQATQNKPSPIRAIVGVSVTNAGADVHQSVPMREQVEKCTGCKIEEHLLDGGYIGLDQIDIAAANNVTIYAPVPKSRKEGVDPHAPKSGDSQAVKEFRERMKTTEAKKIYKLRASSIEPINGECKTYRGLNQILVRGTNKVRCVALFAALAYNIVHFGSQLLA